MRRSSKVCNLEKKPSAKTKCILKAISRDIWESQQFRFRNIEKNSNSIADLKSRAEFRNLCRQRTGRGKVRCATKTLIGFRIGLSRSNS